MDVDCGGQFGLGRCNGCGLGIEVALVARIWVVATLGIRAMLVARHWPPWVVALGLRVLGWPWVVGGCRCGVSACYEKTI